MSRRSPAARAMDVLEVGIFARVSPAEKLALVRAYQAAGEVVAMTGDGVNDAPALRQADIGVAMGLRGTDVAREAAAMILLDDAFPTIVKAIREGRVIFGNIRRFVAYLLSCNLSEVLVGRAGGAVHAALAGAAVADPLSQSGHRRVSRLRARHGRGRARHPQAAAARSERADPRPPQWTVIVLHSLALTAATFGALAAARLWLDLDSKSVVTVTFLTLAFAQLWHAFNMRHPQIEALLRNEVTRNPWLWGALLLCTALLAAPPYLPPIADVMHLVPPTSIMWALILGSSAAPLVVTQAVMLTLASLRPRG